MEVEAAEARQGRDKIREEMEQRRQEREKLDKIILHWEICDRMAQGMQVLFPDTFANG